MDPSCAGSILHQHLAKTCVNVLINLQELHIVIQGIEK